MHLRGKKVPISLFIELVVLAMPVNPYTKGNIPIPNEQSLGKIYENSTRRFPWTIVTNASCIESPPCAQALGNN
jgi:hypothetical protein